VQYTWRRVEGSVNFQWRVECYVVVKLFSTMSFDFPKHPVPLKAMGGGMWWTYRCQRFFFFLFSLEIQVWHWELHGSALGMKYFNISPHSFKFGIYIIFTFCIFLIESLNLTFLLFSFLNLFPIFFSCFFFINFQLFSISSFNQNFKFVNFFRYGPYSLHSLFFNSFMKLIFLFNLVF